MESEKEFEIVVKFDSRYFKKVIKSITSEVCISFGDVV